MKNSKPIIVLAIVCVLIVGGGYLVDKYVQKGIEVGLALERAKVAEAKVAELDLEISAKNTEIAARDVAIEESKAKAAERERWFKKQLEAVEVATPTQLVDTGASILGASDITTDGVTVTMSLATYRKVVGVLVEHKEYVEVKEPAWNAREALYQAQIFDLKGSVAAHERKDILNAGIIADLKDVIKHTKNMGLLEKAAWTAGGFVGGFLASKI